MKKAKLLLAIFGLSMLTFQCVAQNSITNNPIKIGELLVARSDFSTQMKWADARKACEKLKGDWRLPNRAELNLLYLNKDNDGTQDDYLKYTKCWVRPVKIID
jgi:hypothetical protein